MMGSVQVSLGKGRNIVPMIPAAPKEVLGIQMALSKYLLSAIMPGTAKAKKTLTQELQDSEGRHLKENNYKAIWDKNWYYDRISSEHWILQFYLKWRKSV